MTEIIVRHCAPTLAGLKTANLFSYRFDDIDELHKTIVNLNKMLSSKGVLFALVRVQHDTAMIYVFRRHQLALRLNMPDVRSFLRKCGYTDFTVGACIKMLRRRLSGEDFPHEIGIFLGYPLDDVEAFIENKGADCKCAGFWKAYYNIPEAEKTFRRFQKCISVYCNEQMKGADLVRLTVAG